MAEQQPSEFLQRKLAEGAVAFAVYVVLPEGSQSLVDRYDASLGFHELRDRIEERCERHARMGSTVGTFSVEAQDEEKRSMGFEVFRVTANTPGSKVVLSEPANEVGLMAQLMRHLEFHQRTQSTTVSTVLNWQAQMLEEARNEARAANDTRIKMFELVEELQDRKADRDLRLEESRGKAQLKKDAVEKALSLGSLVASHLAPKLAGPQGEQFSIAVSAMRVFETLTAEQLRGILGLLNPEQQAVLIRALQQLTQQREAAQGDSSDTTH